ncbi:MAG TPA: thymidine phosphorylase [Bdellovibrionota bacterium]|jgi:pyrimidine-nucleoside phosphorylase
MNTVQLIKKKRDGESLSKEELRHLVDGFTKGQIPDYQMSAFLMATYFQGMTLEEASDLIALMVGSGTSVELSRVKLPKIDKHSTGGIGDKTTLLLAPLLASCGVAYPTISGRGLGHTGGTLDKLESIPGFNCFLSLKRFEELVSTVGLGFLGQTEEICPADRKIYALRDVTGTVESNPLIVASIMSKKLAEGVDGLVFDVKCGSGAFMKSEPQASALASALVSAAKASGKQASALVTEMSGPIGHAVGNAIEMNECVAFLRQGPQDPPPHPGLHALTMELATELVCVAEQVKGKKRPSPPAVREILENALKSGMAYSKFLEIVSLQGGDTEAVDHGLPLAAKKVPFVAAKKGSIRAMDGEQIGYALIELGGGRRKVTDKVDMGVGFWFEKEVGDNVKKDDVIAQIYAKDLKSAESARKMLEEAVEIGAEPSTKPKLILQRI